jgi:hypothetical protein
MFAWEDAETGRLLPGMSAPEAENSARSGLGLLAGTEERKVTLNSSEGPLGFNIRGGCEFGVGIFVSGKQLFFRFKK